MTSPCFGFIPNLIISSVMVNCVNIVLASQSVNHYYCRKPTDIKTIKKKQCQSVCKSYFHDNILSWNLFSKSHLLQMNCVVLKQRQHTNRKQLWCWEFFINWRAFVPDVDTSCCQLIHPEKKQQFSLLCFSPGGFLLGEKYFLSYPFGIAICFWNNIFFCFKFNLGVFTIS